jgi:uncharacterized protein (DUF1499 family)
MGLFSGKRPDNLGVREGRLSPCKPTPNCVASQADKADAVHYIEPLKWSGPADEGWTALQRVLGGMPRVTIVSVRPGYLYAEFTSRLMGYVDDVEFLLDPAGAIHVRSASRLGRGDLGANRARIEAIRQRLAAEMTR